jgi:PAS domain S-box-containing protein
MSTFHFDEKQFSRLFPFFILINRDLQVAAAGNSLQKICRVSPNTPFNDIFIVKRPYVEVTNLETLLDLRDQLLVLEAMHEPDIALRGQVEYLADKDSILFIGSPWFDSMDQVTEKGLTLHDFAWHDPLIDLLHVLKTQEIVTDDIKKLLITVNQQRKDLKQLSLVAEQTLNAVIFTNENGEIEWTNNAFTRITGYEAAEVKGKKPGALLQGPESDREAILYIREQLQKRESFHCELINYHKNGEPYWAKLTGQALKDRSGKVTQYFAIQEDITRQKQLELELDRQRKFYEDILNNIPADIVVFSTDHRYLFINPKAISNPEIRQWMIGKRDEDYMLLRQKPLEIARQRRKVFEAVIQSKKLNSWEEKLIRPDGTTEYILRNFYPVMDTAGNVSLVIGYGMDITQMKNIQVELELSRQKTEEIASIKQQFLANMSHEIRTPMNGILGIANIFEKTILDPQQKELLDIIQESAKNLLVIVNDVLDLEKIIAGKIELEKIPFNLADKVHITTESFRFKAKEKNIKLQYQNHLPSNLVVLGDPFRLSQVLNNLISNAVKFTEKGSVTISTKLKEQQDDNLIISFMVNDTGIGIDHDRLEDIFEPFTQAKAEIARRFGGTGLGLSICREMVRMLGGNISLKSEEGNGSRFYFEIPFKLSAAIIPTLKKKLIDTELTKKLRILVAEDVDINQFLIRHILQLWDCRFTLVENGQLAVEALEAEDYDIVLMDIQMQEMDGIEATRAIRNLPDRRKAAIPVIALTANALRGDFETYIAAGMNDYLPKPFNDTDLYEIILKTLENKEQTTWRDIDNPEKSPTPPALYSLETLESMSKGDKKFVHQMISLFIDIIPPLQQQLRDAAAAGNWPEVSQTAHKMKPSLDTMGINSIKNSFRTVEHNAKNQIYTEELNLLISEINQVIDACVEALKHEL